MRKYRSNKGKPAPMKNDVGNHESADTRDYVVLVGIDDSDVYVMSRNKDAVRRELVRRVVKHEVAIVPQDVRSASERLFIRPSIESC